MLIRHILFDLDGTLLPMNQDEFVTFYMPLLAKKYLSEGISFDPKAFIASVWKGYDAMVKNDGSCTNREAFWKYMDELLPTDPENSERIALDFYENEFTGTCESNYPTSAEGRLRCLRRGRMRARHTSRAYTAGLGHHDFGAPGDREVSVLSYD